MTPRTPARRLHAALCRYLIARIGPRSSIAGPPPTATAVALPAALLELSRRQATPAIRMLLAECLIMRPHAVRVEGTHAPEVLPARRTEVHRSLPGSDFARSLSARASTYSSS